MPTIQTENKPHETATKTTNPTSETKKYIMPQKEQKQVDQGKRKHQAKPNESFLTKSRAAALQQTKIHMEKEQN